MWLISLNNSQVFKGENSKVLGVGKDFFDSLDQ